MTSQTVEPQIHPWSFRFTPAAQIHRCVSLESQLNPWSLKASLEPFILIGQAPGGRVSSVAHTGPRWYGIRGCWGPPSHYVEALLGMFMFSRMHIFKAS